METSPTPSQVVGVAWFRPEQWTLLRAVCADSDRLELTYEEWVKEASAKAWELQQQGYAVRRVDVELAELVLWCEAKGRPVDEAARAEFVVSKL